MSSVICPVCAEHFSTNTGRGRSTTDNVRNHMKKVHRMSADEVDAILLNRGIIRPRVVVDDAAISMWNDLVARGVIE
jgi:hypothetical protein